MDGLTSFELKDFIWVMTGSEVSIDWKPDGRVCIDLITTPGGYGGNKLRNAMADDYKKNKNTYVRANDGKDISPQNKYFYRKNALLRQFFQNSGRYTNKYTPREEMQ